MHATDLTDASIWRAKLGGTQLENIMCSGMSWYGKVYDDSSEDVKIKAWDQEYYNSYVNRIRDALRNYSNAEQVLNKIELLDCRKSDVENDTITPCGLSPAYPETVKDDQKTLNATCLDLSNSNGKEFSSLNEKLRKKIIEIYAKSALRELEKIVCDGDKYAIFILRRTMEVNPVLVGHPLERPPKAASQFVSTILSKTCYLSSALTDTDRGALKKLAARAVAMDSE